MFSYLSNYVLGDGSKKEGEQLSFFSKIFFFFMAALGFVRACKGPILSAGIDLAVYPRVFFHIGLIKPFVFIAFLVLYLLLSFFIKRKYVIQLLSGLFAFGVLCVAIGSLFLFQGVFQKSSGAASLIVYASNIFTHISQALMPLLLWAYILDQTSFDFAKKSFPLIAGSAVLGGGLAFAATYYVGHVMALSMAVVSCLYACSLFAAYYQSHEKKEEARRKPERPRGVFFYGLSLFFLAFFHIIFMTISFNHMVSFARIYAPSIRAYSLAVDVFGLVAIFFTFLFALMFSYRIIKTYGVSFALLVAPIVTGVAFGSLCVLPYNPVVTAVALAVKVIAFALYVPVFHMLYFAFSRRTRFKVKVWTELFCIMIANFISTGIMRSSQGGLQQSLVHHAKISLFLILIWIAVSYFAGKRCERFVEDEAIGER